MAKYENPYDEIDKMMEDGVEFIDIKLASRLVFDERERIVNLIRKEMMFGVAEITDTFLDKILFD
jgi:hypothetical protein